MALWTDSSFSCLVSSDSSLDKENVSSADRTQQTSTIITLLLPVRYKVAGQRPVGTNGRAAVGGWWAVGSGVGTLCTGRQGYDAVQCSMSLMRYQMPRVHRRQREGEHGRKLSAICNTPPEARRPT